MVAGQSDSNREKQVVLTSLKEQLRASRATTDELLDQIARVSAAVPPTTSSRPARGLGGEPNRRAEYPLDPKDAGHSYSDATFDRYRDVLTKCEPRTVTSKILDSWYTRADLPGGCTSNTILELAKPMLLRWYVEAMILEWSALNSNAPAEVSKSKIRHHKFHTAFHKQTRRPTGNGGGLTVEEFCSVVAMPGNALGLDASQFAPLPVEFAITSGATIHHNLHSALQFGRSMADCMYFTLYFASSSDNPSGTNPNPRSSYLAYGPGCNRRLNSYQSDFFIQFDKGDADNGWLARDEMMQSRNDDSAIDAKLAEKLMSRWRRAQAFFRCDSMRQLEQSLELLAWSYYRSSGGCTAIDNWCHLIKSAKCPSAGLVGKPSQVVLALGLWSSTTGIESSVS